MNTAPRAEPGQYLTFRVADEEYGAPILQVREIVRFQGVTRVPTAPPAIRGVLSLRGSVVPVVDLGLKLGLAPTPTTPRTCIVVAEAHTDGAPEVIGLLADAVDRVAEFGPGEIEPVPTFGTRVPAEGLLGLGRAGSRFIPILDLQRLLSESELRGATPLDGGASPDALPNAAEQVEEGADTASLEAPA